MTAAFSKSLARHRAGEKGFTLIELLVVIVILGILAAVVVFAVGGTGDKGQNAAVKTDAETLRTAQEAHCARLGRYAKSDQELVSSQFLSEESDIHEVVEGGFGQTACGKYVIDSTKPGFGQADQVDLLTLPTVPNASVQGFPSPFAFGVGPGFNNMHYVFDSLTWKDATGNYIPWVATSVPTVANGGITNNGLTYTYNVRPGIKFSDNENLDASDVAFTFDYIKNGAGAAPSGFYYSLEFIDTVTVGTPPDPTNGGGTVVFNLKRRFAPFEALFGSRVPIIPEHIWSKVTPATGLNPLTYGSPADAGRNSVEGNGRTRAQNAVTGSGPYTVEGVAAPASAPGSGNTYTFKARTAARRAMSATEPPPFFLGDPFVRELQFSTAPAPAAGGALSAVAAGTMDAAGPEDGQAVPSNLNGFDRINAGGENTLSLFFNMLPTSCGTLPACVGGARPTGASVNSFPYDNKAFRQAVAYTIDRRQLVNVAIKGLGEVGSMGGLAPSNAFTAPGLPTYDREVAKANALLDSIGIVDTADADAFRELPGGAVFTPVIKYEVPSPSSAFAINESATRIVNYLKEIGINASASTTSFTRADVTNGRYDMALVSHGAMGAEPDQLRNRISRFDSILQFTDVYGFTPTNQNPITSSDPGFDALADAQVSNLDAASRRSQLNRMQQIIADEVPVISLWVPNRTWVFSSKPVPWYFTPGGLWSGWPGAPSKQLFVDGKRVAPPRT
jgi:peptide/nickel transport system substrate-binding protein